MDIIIQSAQGMFGREFEGGGGGGGYLTGTNQSVITP